MIGPDDLSPPDQEPVGYIQARVAKLTHDRLMRDILELEKACWRMIANGQLFSLGWRLGVSYHPKTGRQSTLPIPPGDPVPAGISRVLSLTNP